jgi:hypothetical protein
MIHAELMLEQQFTTGTISITTTRAIISSRIKIKPFLGTSTTLL